MNCGVQPQPPPHRQSLRGWGYSRRGHLMADLSQSTRTLLTTAAVSVGRLTRRRRVDHRERLTRRTDVFARRRVVARGTDHRNGLSLNRHHHHHDHSQTCRHVSSEPSTVLLETLTNELAVVVTLKPRRLISKADQKKTPRICDVAVDCEARSARSTSV